MQNEKSFNSEFKVLKFDEEDYYINNKSELTTLVFKITAGWVVLRRLRLSS